MKNVLKIVLLMAATATVADEVSSWNDLRAAEVCSEAEPSEVQRCIEEYLVLLKDEETL